MSIKEFIILSKVLIKGLIPPGGTTGQIIKKKSEKNFDVEWGTGGSGGGDVSSINDVLPDENGNVDISTDDIPEGTKKYLTGNEFNKVVDDMDDISDGTTYKKVSTTEKNTWNGKQDALGYTAEDSANKSTNIVTDAASNTKFPSVKAIKDYADGLVVGLWDDRGTYDASVNVYPSTGGSGTAGAVLKGDIWTVSVIGTLGGVAVEIGDTVRALTDSPGQISSNWAILQNNIGYTAENSSNKTSTFQTTPDNTKYPTEKLLFDTVEKKAMANPGIDERTPVTVSINYTTRVLTVTGTLGYFNFYTDGSGVITKHTKNAPVEFPAFTDTTGRWYFYFDNSGNPISTQTAWTDFSTISPIYRLTWNSTKTPDSAKAISENIEYHSNSISYQDHAWKHAQGVIWLEGFTSVHNALTSGSPNADGRNTCFGLITGINMDDNLLYTVTNSTGGSEWQQDLGVTSAASLTNLNSGIFNIRYKGVAGAPELVTGSKFPFLWDSVTNRPQYVNTSGARTLVTDDTFFVYFVYAIQDKRNGQAIRITPAYGEYATLALAQSVTWATVQTQDEAASDNEIRVLYRLIFYNNYTGGSPYDVAVKYTVLREVQDLRKQTITQSTNTGGSLNASNVIVTPAGNISATNAQAAFEELDTEKQTVLTGTNFGTFTNGLTGKSTPVDADAVIFMDSAASNVSKKTLWSEIKSTLKTYFDTLYSLLNTTTLGSLLNGATEKSTLVDNDLLLAGNSEDSFKIVKEKYSNFKTNLVSYIASSALTVSGVFSFVKDKIALVGTSTGKTTLSTANTSTSNYTQTFQAKTGTVANLDDNITGTAQGCDLAAGKQIAYTVPTVDGTATGNVTSAFNCGYSSSAVGDVVYLDSSSTWQKADMNTSETTYSGLLAIALEVKASGNALKVALPGSMIYATGFPTLTVGGKVYLSDDGAITQTASTTNNDARRVLGHAIHADKIWFNPSNDYVVYQA